MVHLLDDALGGRAAPPRREGRVVTAEQFVFWLRGFTARAPTTGFTSSEWKAVTETLKLVASPQADADARLVAQKRLYAERDAFL